LVIGLVSEKDKRKPREEYIGAVTRGVVENITIGIEGNDKIIFGPEMQDAYYESTYERPKGPKVINRVPLDSRCASFDPWVALPANYDQLFAVDTNTRDVGGIRISVTGILEVRQNWVCGRDGISGFWKFESPFCLEFTELQPRPENFGWLMAIDRLEAKGRVDRVNRIGLIVDSDLGQLADYNSRKKPFCEQVYLPKNITLIYASGDGSKDRVLNKALSVADSVSSQCLDALSKGIIPLNTKNYGVDWCKGFRIINHLQ
jgi:hypothetical protein